MKVILKENAPLTEAVQEVTAEALLTEYNSLKTALGEFQQKLQNIVASVDKSIGNLSAIMKKQGTVAKTQEKPIDKTQQGVENKTQPETVDLNKKVQ